MTQVRWALSADPGEFVPWDPVNLVFLGEASASVVGQRLKDDFGLRWRNTGLLSGRLFAFMAGLPGVEQDEDLAFGSVELRYHLRLYSVPFSASDPLGSWCIGGVHLEHLRVGWAQSPWHVSRRSLRELAKLACPAFHEVSTWKEPQLVVEALFAGHSLTRSVARHPLPNAIAYQQTDTEPGIAFDGLATFVELRR